MQENREIERKETEEQNKRCKETERLRDKRQRNRIRGAGTGDREGWRHIRAVYIKAIGHIRENYSQGAREIKKHSEESERGKQKDRKVRKVHMYKERQRDRLTT